MKAGLAARLHKLEQQREAAPPPYRQVLWLGVDGLPDPPDQALAPEGPIVVLPRKAKTVDEWVATVRQRWEGRDPATVNEAWWDARPWLEKR